MHLSVCQCNDLATVQHPHGATRERQHMQYVYHQKQRLELIHAARRRPPPKPVVHSNFARMIEKVPWCCCNARTTQMLLQCAPPRCCCNARTTQMLLNNACIGTAACRVGGVSNEPSNQKAQGAYCIQSLFSCCWLRV